jgi:dolichol-phosphate mannosyltransferase
LPEANRYVRGLIHWLGFRQIGIPYTRLGRTTGVSKANPWYLIGFTLNAIFTTSIKPLRFFSLLGLGVLGLTAGLGLHSFISSLWGASSVGMANLLLLLNLGVMSLGVGVLGEYLARIHAETRRRPLWFVDYTLNLDSSTDASKTVANIPHGGPATDDDRLSPRIRENGWPLPMRIARAPGPRQAEELSA